MLKTIQLNKIIPDPEQPRKIFAKPELVELKNSISVQGILTPLLVESNYQTDHYLLLDGERRYCCSKELNLENVPVNIIEGPLSCEERTEKRFHAQEQHSDWSELNKAQAIYEYKQMTNKTIAEIADTLNLQVPKVHGYLSVTDLTDAGKKLIDENKIKFTYLIYLIRIVKHYLIISEFTQEHIEEQLINRILSGEFKNMIEFQKLSDLLHQDGYVDDKLKFLENPQYTLKECLDDAKIFQANELNIFYKNIVKFDILLATYIEQQDTIDDKSTAVLESIKEKINVII